MSTKQAIVNNVLGECVPILYNDTLMKSLKFTTYEESDKIHTYDNTQQTDIAFLMPRDAMLGALENNSTLGLIMHLTACPEYYFYLQPSWNTLKTVVPLDSIFHVVLYMDKSQKIRMGIFDMSLFFGIAQTDISMLTRHHRLYQYLHEYQPKFFHLYHWIGYSQTCYDCLKNNITQNTLPFDVNYMVILSSNSNTLQKIIRPIQTTTP